MSENIGPIIQDVIRELDRRVSLLEEVRYVNPNTTSEEGSDLGPRVSGQAMSETTERASLHRPHPIPNVTIYTNSILPAGYPIDIPYLQTFICGPIGSESAYLGAVLYKDQIMVRRGCFTGTWREFKDRVRSQYPDREQEHRRIYSSILNLLLVIQDTRREQLPKYRGLT